MDFSRDRQFALQLRVSGDALLELFPFRRG